MTKFLIQFEAAVNKFKYSYYDKLQLLKQQVSRQESKLLHSLEADKQGYKEAHNLLETALASTAVRKFDTIKKVAQIKLSYQEDLFYYIFEIKAIKENINKISITVDDFLQHFFWDGLNESFKSQLIQLTNKTTPSLKGITDRFFDAAERYSTAQKHYRDRKKYS